MTQVWYRCVPPYAEVGKPLQIEMMAREGLAHVSLAIEHRDTAQYVDCVYVSHEHVSGMNIWAWNTEGVPTDGSYSVVLWAEGKELVRHGFWTLGYYDPFIVEPDPEPEPEPEPDPDYAIVRGVHDRSGGDWLLEQGLTGYVMIPAYLDLSPQKWDLDRYLDRGIQVIVNLRSSYAVHDGGQGTMPGPGQIRQFEDACVQTMADNPGAIYFYCNEPNNSREFPKNFALTPQYCLESYQRVWARKPASVKLGPGAIDPTNAASWGDWRQTWFVDVLSHIDADVLSFHAYTHGPNLDYIWHRKEFDHAPLLGAYYDLRMLETQQECVPSHLVGLPQYVTETNHLTRWDGTQGWQDVGEWVRQAYEYFAERGVVTACLFRYSEDEKWYFYDKPGVLRALKEVG